MYEIGIESQTFFCNALFVSFWKHVVRCIPACLYCSNCQLNSETPNPGCSNSHLKGANWVETRVEEANWKEWRGDESTWYSKFWQDTIWWRVWRTKLYNLVQYTALFYTKDDQNAFDGDLSTQKCEIQHNKNGWNWHTWNPVNSKDQMQG